MTVIKINNSLTQDDISFIKCILKDFIAVAELDHDAETLAAVDAVKSIISTLSRKRITISDGNMESIFLILSDRFEYESDPFIRSRIISVSNKIADSLSVLNK